MTVVQLHKLQPPTDHLEIENIIRIVIRHTFCGRDSEVWVTIGNHRHRLADGMYTTLERMNSALGVILNETFQVYEARDITRFDWMERIRRADETKDLEESFVFTLNRPPILQALPSHLFGRLFADRMQNARQAHRHWNVWEYYSR